MKNTLFNALKVYIATLIIICIFTLINTSFSRVIELLATLFSTQRGLIFFHVLFLIFYLIFIISKYFLKIYSQSGFKQMIKKLFLRLILPITVVVFIINFIVKVNTAEDFNYKWNFSVENTTGKVNNSYALDGKHREMSVYRLERNINSQIEHLIKDNVEWVSLFPYFYQKDESTTQVNTPDHIGEWSTQDSMFIQNIKTLHKSGMRVMLKPHLWMSEGWRSNIHFDNPNAWNTWFLSYKKIMLHYAQMAAQNNVELFCIGTELRSSITKQSEQWKLLIKDIKSIYKGKLTYAANWDGEFEDVSFWEELDFIGVQAYFPLTTHKAPNLKDIKKGWNKHKITLRHISNRYNKPILFTEVGYRNDLYATVEPWEWGSFLDKLYRKTSNETASLAYEALFSELWHEAWFAGLYAWQWNSGDFPIRNKPVENIITKWYHFNNSKK